MVARQFDIPSDIAPSTPEGSQASRPIQSVLWRRWLCGQANPYLQASPGKTPSHPTSPTNW